MYNVLLVDDEPAILNGLLKAIPWKEYSFDQIYTAGDGIEAMKLIEQNGFDLIITDIRMPNMNGLELMRKVQSCHPGSRFIILTAYNEFEYAIEALHLGAENYLLKPLNIAELSATIEKAINNINDCQRAHAIQIKSENVFKENVLSRWVSGDLYGPELSERASIAGINIFSRSYCVVIVKTLVEDQSCKNFKTQIENTLSMSYDCNSFNDSNGSRVFIIGGYDVVPLNIKTMLTELFKQFDKAYFIFIAIGMKAFSYEEVSASYKSTNNIIRFRMLFPQNTIIIAEELQESGFNKISLNYIEFCRLLRESSETEVLSATEKIIRKILDHTRDSIPAAKALLIELLLHIARETEKSLMEGQELPPSMQNLFSRLDSITTNTDLINWMCAIITDARQIIQEKKQDVSPIINLALQYIKKHCDQPLSIKDLSGMLGINPSYLGYLFNKETGLYFSNYLNQARIQISKELLLTTNMNIQDIAEKVGYSDVSYFSQIFKKALGLSPVKYRQINRYENL